MCSEINVAVREYTTDLDAEGVRKALSAARRQRIPDWTATPKSPGNFANPA